MENEKTTGWGKGMNQQSLVLLIWQQALSWYLASGQL